MCIRVLQIDFPGYWLQCTMPVQLFNGVLTVILQHLQKYHLMCIHFPSISCSTNCLPNEASITLSHDCSEHSSEVSESEQGYCKPDLRERKRVEKMLKLCRSLTQLLCTKPLNKLGSFCTARLKTIDALRSQLW